MASQIEHAWQLYQNGDFKAAINAVADDVGSSLLADLDRAKLATICLKTGQIERGLALLDCDWTLANPDAAGLVGALMFSLGNFSLALAPLMQAVQGVTLDPGAHLVNLGRNLTLMGRPEEALPYLQQV